MLGERCLEYALIVTVLTAGVAAAASDGSGITGDASNEVRVLKDQVVNLVEALAGARREVDSLRYRVTSREFMGNASVSLRPAQMSAEESAPPQLLGVDRELRMAVLDKGVRQGIQPGTTFAVLREDKVVAELETVDVREKIAGAVIVNIQSGMFPEAGDRLMRIVGLTK
ncbi:MAG: hypothetical protein WCP86_00935 [bacterium]